MSYPYISSSSSSSSSLSPSSPSSSSSPSPSSVSDDITVYPLSPEEYRQLESQLSQSQSSSSSSSSLDEIISLVEFVKRQCQDDNDRIRGTKELLIRLRDLSSQCENYKKYLLDDNISSSPHVKTEIKNVKMSLITGKFILSKALQTNFRRSARFKSPIKILINDVVIGTAKVSAAISLAHSTANYNKTSSDNNTHTPSSAPPSLFPSIDDLKNGHEDCLLGDKYYYGHGVEKNYVKSLEFYKKASYLKYPPAMNSLATMMREGKGGKKELSLSLEIYKEAAGMGNLDALYNLGQMYEIGEGVNKSLDLSIEYYSLAANSGHCESQCNLGFIYEHGGEDLSNFVPIDIEAAAAWYEEAAEKGYAKAQNNLGFLHFTGLIKPNGKSQNKEKDKGKDSENPHLSYEIAIQWFEKAALSGHAGAQNNLGICYESGKGKPKNDDMALNYYLESAKQGHPSSSASCGYLFIKMRKFDKAMDFLRKGAEQSDKEALYHLAQMYHHGLHVEKNDFTAFLFYTKSAEQGHPYALLEIGHSLFSGRGVKKDIFKAMKFYQQAALLGVSEAENACGIMWEEGVGTECNYQEAFNCYRRAALKGNPDAIYNLSLLYEEGKGVDKDINMANQKLSEAMELGSLQAKIRQENKIKNNPNPNITSSSHE